VHYHPGSKAAASSLKSCGILRNMSLGQNTVKNPAVLSARLRALFPPGTLAAELREDGDPVLLYPEEAAHLGNAVAVRRQQFAAGRLCARCVLAQFGILNFPLKAAEDRQPLWPENLVGSITHTDGFGAAVAADKQSLAALGIDSEVAGRVTPKLWRSICTPGEIRWLQALPESQQAAAATLIFAAKEAFYKCQYPLVGEWLNFHDASIEVRQWGAADGAMTIYANKSIAFAQRTSMPLEGRYLFHEQFVTAGVAVVAGAISTPCRPATP
jgi:4'-phosphopantetheinyl transferase EntD